MTIQQRLIYVHQQLTICEDSIWMCGELSLSITDQNTLINLRAKIHEAAVISKMASNVIRTKEDEAEKPIDTTE